MRDHMFLPLQKSRACDSTRGVVGMTTTLKSKGQSQGFGVPSASEESKCACLGHCDINGRLRLRLGKVLAEDAGICALLQEVLEDLQVGGVHVVCHVGASVEGGPPPVQIPLIYWRPPLFHQEPHTLQLHHKDKMFHTLKARAAKESSGHVQA